MRDPVWLQARTYPEAEASTESGLFGWPEEEVEYEQVPLTSADSTLASRVVPSNACRVNLTPRPAASITHVVVHSLVGHYANAIEQWRTGASCFKPHYVIRNDGEITQVVAEAHTPQHANNANRYSIGIEHDGFANAPSYFTEAMYVASAELTRDICQRRSIPVDRTHIIGHDEAPGTTHGDPGGYWDWDYYMALVRWNGDPSRRPIRIVVDYSSFSFWPTSDHWQVVPRGSVLHSPHPKHSYGPSYYRAQPDPRAEEPAVFLPTPPVTGRYDVSAWWPVIAGNNTDAGITVRTGQPLAVALSRRVNQATMQGRTRRTLALPFTPTWLSLGTVTLAAGDAVWVEVSRRSTRPGWIVADAIRLLKV